MNFDHEELMLMMLYNTGTRLGLIHELRLMQCYLMPDEVALRELSEDVIEKVWTLPKKPFPAHGRKCFPARSSRPPPRLHPLPVPLPKIVRLWWLRSASRSPQNRLHKS